MFNRLLITVPIAVAALAALGCSDVAMDEDTGAGLPRESGIALDLVRPGESMPFAPLASSAACVAGGKINQVELPPGFIASTVATEGAGFLDAADMQTVNETGRQRGRFLYRTHELGNNAGVSVTDLVTGVTSIVAQRSDWERFDGLVWTPWGTLLAAEEVGPSALKDPTQPNASGGHVYEIDPLTGIATVRPALGAKSHEGMRFDRQGNVYGISETGPGYIYKFVPDHHGDLSSGQLYALKLVTDLGNRTGWAMWVALDRQAVLVDAVAEAAAKGAVGYARPEDVEIGTSTGNDRRGNHTLYVAVTGEDRVLAIDLEPKQHPDQAFVSDYVKDGLNAPADFDFPDNLALDQSGNLYITEDPGGSAAGGKALGDDVWFAPFNPVGASASLPVRRFFSITDCDAEPTGIYLSPTGKTLFVDIQHRGGSDPRDLSVGIQRLSDVDFDRTSRR